MIQYPLGKPFLAQLKEEKTLQYSSVRTVTPDNNAAVLLDSSIFRFEVIKFLTACLHAGCHPSLAALLCTYYLKPSSSTLIFVQF